MPDLELICLPGSPWTAKVLWILDAASIDVSKRPFEPFVDEIWLRYKLGLWPWHGRFWSRMTVPIGIVNPSSIASTGGGKAEVMMESFDIAEWALNRSAVVEKPTDATLSKLRYWNDLSDVILRYGRAFFVDAAKRDVRVAIEVLSPPWMKKLPYIITKPLMYVALRVFAFKYRRENADSSLESVLQAVRKIRAALKEGKGKYLMNDRLSYADMVIAIALDFLVPSDGVLLFSIPKKYRADADDPLREFEDVKAWKLQMFEHLPACLKVST